MEEEVPFEAQQVLQDLYSLDAVVQGIQAGNWERYIATAIEHPHALCALHSSCCAADNKKVQSCTMI